MKKPAMFAALAALIFCAGAFAQDLGSVEIPRNVTIKNVSVSAGTYTVALSQEGNNVMIQLKQGDRVVVSELAITKPADRNFSSARIMYQSLRRDGSDDPLVGRVWTSYQGALYLLYCEK